MKYEVDGLRSLAHRARETMGRAVVQAAAAACIAAALEDASDVFPGLLTRIGAPRVYFYIGTYFLYPLFFLALFLLLTSPSLLFFLLQLYYLFNQNSSFFPLHRISLFTWYRDVHALEKWM